MEGLHLFFLREMLSHFKVEYVSLGKCTLVIFHWIYLHVENIFKMQNKFCAKKVTPQYDHLQNRKYPWTDLELSIWFRMQISQ